MFILNEIPVEYNMFYASYSAFMHIPSKIMMNFDKIIAHPDDFHEFCVFKNPQLCNHYVSKQLTTLLPSTEK
jgi:hypothetical protein